MIPTEIIEKVRHIEIRTRSLVNDLFGGEYHSVFKGRGMSFSEVREYIPGDDIRLIDWNVTARSNLPHVKIFEEERELTVYLVVDISKSGDFGTLDKYKNEIATEIAAVLGFSAIKNNDKVGLILFTDQVELYIPPKKGKTHILRIIRELIEFKPVNQKTDINVPLQFLSNILNNRAIVFLISDFISEDYSNSLRIISSKHDITGIRVYDKSEITIPNLGLVQLMDNEENKMKLVYTGSKKVRKNYEKYYQNRIQLFGENFKKAGAGIIECSTEDSYQKKLLRYFRNR